MSMTLEKVLAQLVKAPSEDAVSDLRTLREAFVRHAGRISDADLAQFSNVALALLLKVPLIERIAFARQVAKNRNVPRALLMRMATDHYLVSAPVLESAPLLSEADLASIIERVGMPVCLAIAKRDELSLNLTDILMTHADEGIRRTLAGNTGARLSRKSMTTLCALAEQDTSVLEALGRRRDMPLELANRIKSLRGSQARAAQGTEPPAASAPGRGRAGIVLSQAMVAAKPKKQKTFRYS